MAAYQATGFDLTGAGEPERVSGVRASGILLSLLRVSPALGRAFSPDEDAAGKKQVVLLGHRLWQERFGGSKDVLGKGLTLNGNSYSVIGVMPAGFRFTALDADVWVPIGFEAWEMENRGGHDYQAIARLKPGVTLEQASTEMNVIAARLGQQFEVSKGWGVTLISMQDQLIGGSRKSLLILFGAVGLVLLIACANVANLLLARAATRERELAVRASLGAGRGRLLRQLLSEGLVLAAGGLLAGWLVAFWTMAAILKLGEASLPRLENVHLDGQVLGFTLVVSLVTGLLFSLAPACLASRASLSEVLKDTTRGTTHGRRQRFRASFVVVQIALGMVLLVGSSLLLRSFARLQAVDLGYQTDHILTDVMSMSDARFPSRETERKAFVNRVVEHVANLPGVDSAASAMGAPLGFIGARSQVFVEGRPEPMPNEAQAAGYSQISSNYFQTIGTPLLRGRHFDARDTTTAPFIAIVNEAFVRAFFPNEEPIGKRLKVMDSHRDQSTEIVGVVRDMRQRDIAAQPGPEMYFPMAQRCWFDVQIVVRTRVKPAAMTSALRQAVAEMDSSQTIYFVRTLDSLAADALAQRRWQMLLLAAFASLALLLSAVGIYGVMACVVTQRTQEIGVRMALGAQMHHVLHMVLRQGMTLVLIGIAVGLSGAFTLTRLLRSLLYEVSPTDYVTFTVIPMLLAAVAFFACWLPARRAAKVDPMQALRHE